MSGVLRGIARLSLLLGVLDVAAALLDLMGVAGFEIPRAVVALIVWRHGRGFSHCWLRYRTIGQRAVNARVSFRLSGIAII
jgi:hypothetical protein